MCCWPKPCTFGSRAISRSMSCDKTSARIPSLLTSGGTTPPSCATSAARQMDRLNLLVLVLRGDFLRALHRLLSLYGQFFKSQHLFPRFTYTAILNAAFKLNNSANLDGHLNRISNTKGMANCQPSDYSFSLGWFASYFVPVPAAAELAIAGEPTFTFICFGLASSRFGITSVKTPF